MKLPAFKNLVSENWSKAVSHASNNLEYYRKELIESLDSENPDERSAAVTSFNEADDTSVHDLITNLIDDRDHFVRQEVYEYLHDLGNTDDIKPLFERINKDLDLIDYNTATLQRLTGRDKGLLSGDDPKEKIEKEISDWEIYLNSNNYI